MVRRLLHGLEWAPSCRNYVGQHYRAIGERNTPNTRRQHVRVAQRLIALDWRDSMIHLFTAKSMSTYDHQRKSIICPCRGSDRCTKSTRAHASFFCGCNAQSFFLKYAVQTVVSFDIVLLKQRPKVDEKSNRLKNARGENTPVSR